jgi:hypothetical protein
LRTASNDLFISVLHLGWEVRLDQIFPNGYTTEPADRAPPRPVKSARRSGAPRTERRQAAGLGSGNGRSRAPSHAGQEPSGHGRGAGA